VMLVMLDEPKNEKWGSEAAAPIFSGIVRDVLRYLEVPPRDVPGVQIVTATPDAPATLPREPVLAGMTPAIDEATAERAMPDLRGKTLRQALAALAPLGVHVDVHGRGRVVSQAPAPLAPVDEGLTARLELSLSPPAAAAQPASVTRPRAESAPPRPDLPPRTVSALGRGDGAVLTTVVDAAATDR